MPRFRGAPYSTAVLPSQWIAAAAWSGSSKTWKSRPSTWIETLRTGTVPIEAANVPGVRVAVQHERRLVLGDRGGEPVGAEERLDPRRLADERRVRRRVVQQHDPHRAQRDRAQAALQRLDVARGLGVDLAQQRLAEVRQVRAGEAADEALHADDADLDAGALAGAVVAVEHVTPPLDSIAATSSSRRFACQSWLPSTANTGMPTSAAGLGEHRALLRLAGRREVAGEQQQVRLPAQRARSSRPSASRWSTRQCTSPAAATRTTSCSCARPLPRSRCGVSRASAGVASGRCAGCRLLVHLTSPTPHRSRG